ncbi:hypothetical protein OG204_24045 [Streptomyces sp. NBC_01387]|uniref:hypothetical protein n=1 Tax=unclassified Streptomyces TaxID=2593676 RepID=UPI0020242F4D|nr:MULTISPECIES: hypothetical protein [unclassified Streptomyces]MCX4548606.1 hypothetical protein [Streptomyces sp. NBC_01500]WSC20217.1 hypothetical protein OIE60_11240 [Streptomyces sp. NBC_01766]WSV54241.1 hypothetical protein OG282_11220 [Streptomyces sp. NBC_01014]
MNRPDRKEDVVRRMLEGPHPLVPADLVARATVRGTRMRRRRTAGRRLLWLLLTAGLVVFVVWAAVTHPWAPPPVRTTPPVEGF